MKRDGDGRATGKTTLGWGGRRHCPLDKSTCRVRKGCWRGVDRGGGGGVEHSTGLTVMNKDDASPVTVADRAAEAAMRDAIGAAFPSHGVYGEEAGMQGGGDGGGEWVWVLDPIDGTKSFITGIHPPPAPCIALDGGEPFAASIATYDGRVCHVPVAPPS